MRCEGGASQSVSQSVSPLCLALESTCPSSSIAPIHLSTTHSIDALPLTSTALIPTTLGLKTNVEDGFPADASRRSGSQDCYRLCRRFLALYPPPPRRRRPSLQDVVAAETGNARVLEASGTVGT